MPLYSYEILTENNEPTGEIIDIFQTMSEEHLTKDPKSGRKIRKIISCPTILIDSTKPKTIGALAEKNTAEMLKNGDPRVKPSAAKAKKKLNIRGWTPRQTERYIMEGHKPNV